MLDLRHLAICNLFALAAVAATLTGYVPTWMICVRRAAASDQKDGGHGTRASSRCGGRGAAPATGIRGGSHPAVAYPLLGNCAYNDSAGNSAHCQPNCWPTSPTVANMGDSVHAPDATLVRIPKQRLCPGTEEVTGSNPVSPTTITPGQTPFSHDLLPLQVALC